MPPPLSTLFARLPQAPDNPVITWQERILFTILLIESTLGLPAVVSRIKLVLLYNGPSPSASAPSAREDSIPICMKKRGLFFLITGGRHGGKFRLH
jgi:hypothetical protein